ncbi:PREDICTED: probable alpha,alpha-trehalose-phosphate synthase [UDP-forming] 11 [Fragaria vesca subsp. vesca]|uniref:probable alpha,alpha-trehalose-phosphate synthase [UDP-forming] 11 n=1 Tax=Fragaria vesca subsp. vesca TaxID=101020 RepID=UPI0002C3553C|nr:PREDICTED: probable alpha,alpha-trehalose-phosphate synthase [UDP-forming] 11 [Fragaria vesca subsp. vesca]
MLSRSCFDLLNLDPIDDFRAVSRIPRVMKASGFISDFENADHHGSGGSSSSSSSDNKNNNNVVSSAQQEQQRRIIVSNHLPIHAFRDAETNKWSFEYDHDSLVLQLKDGGGFPPNVEVLYVGCLKGAEIDPCDQDDVALVLLHEFHCVPCFLPTEILNKFYHGFCKHYLWPLFHYMLPMTPSHGARFDRALWQAYVSANKAFADRMIEVLNPDEDYVWIHDYHLMVLPTFLRKRYYRVKLGFFLHSPFPSSEIYRTIPVREEILRALLNCDLIGFHIFDYARHFLSCCSRMLGLHYEFKRGYMGLEYYGRIVSIKMLPVGIHMGQLQSVMSLGVTAEKVKALKEKFEGKIVILGVDDMDLFKGISLKFLAMKQLLEEHHSLRGKVVLVQITNPARSGGKDVQEVLSEMSAIAKEINKKYGQPGYQPIVVIHGPVTTQEKAAYYAISECCLVNAVRDGMNLVPYTYSVCRQGSSVLHKALGIVDEAAVTKKSVIIVSEFIGCSPSLSGAIRVNPWNIDAVSGAMNFAITMSEEEKHFRHDKHYKYISSHDVAYWAQSFDQDLERACREHYRRRCWGIGLGLGFRVVALGFNFRKLSVDHIAYAYRNTSSRLILLDYDGTMTPQASVDKAPSSEVISVLNCLCSDPKNIVFIVSGRGKNSLSKWFSQCEKLGLSAEHGYFTRWSKYSPWETCTLTMDYSWKKIVLPIMESYTEATDGSFIEQKDSALVWHHQDGDPHFGSSQAKELLDHLESVLVNEPVVVKRGQHIVEVKPLGVSKGKVVEELLSTMQNRVRSPDFLLCIGDDRSDEDMFKSIMHPESNPSMPAIAEVFACTVGQKPSMAKYYLDDTVDVIQLLQGVASASAQPKSVPQHPESFEVFI